MKSRFVFERGFTLLELLVVIAIIGILTAMLFPAISKTKQKARRVTCMNNLRQINLGVRMYSDDLSDLSPSPGTSAATTNFTTLYSGYKELIKTYVGLNHTVSPRDKLFACPSDVFYASFISPGTNQAHYVRKSLCEQSVFDYSSYTFNGGDNVATKTPKNVLVQWPGLTGRKLSSISNPVRTALVTEASALFPWSWHDPQWPDVPRQALTYNDARNMVSFVDGHVSYVKIYWNSDLFLAKGPSFAINYDPPPSYAYQWSGD